MHVLVVDDDRDIRAFVAEALEDEGYHVVTAPHGAAALDLIRQKPPTLVLLDMRMPVMDGWAFAAEYRRIPEARAPVVVMTAAQNARKWSEEVGADGYLAKPFELDDLLETVEQHVRRLP